LSWVETPPGTKDLVLSGVSTQDKRGTL
jgi:hypothetical protein